MTTTTMAELPSLKGKELGSSSWIEITQERVNTFADATDDHQWIHLDVERAEQESPFAQVRVYRSTDVPAGVVPKGAGEGEAGTGFGSGLRRPRNAARSPPGSFPWSRAGRRRP